MFINRLDKHLARVTRKKREKTQITNIWNEREDITKNTTDIKGIRDIMNNFMPVK